MRMTSLLQVLLLTVGCLESDEVSSKDSLDEPDFALGEPGKADGVASGEDRQRIERAFDEAVAAGESTVAQLEAEIATLEAGHRQKQAEADALVTAIANRRAELEENYNDNLLLCALFPNPLTCVLANYLANDSTLTSYEKQLADARTEQARIASELAEYGTKRDGIRTRVDQLRAGKLELLAMLRAEAPPSAPPPLLAESPAAANALWRVSAMEQVQVKLNAEVLALVELRNLAVGVSTALDQSLSTLRKLEANVDQLVLNQRKQFMELLAGLASGDPAAAATKFLNQQIAAKTRMLLNGLGWPMNEFAVFLASNRGDGAFRTLVKKLMEKLIADAQPRIYVSQTDVAILDNTRAASELVVQDQRPADHVEIAIELEHSYVGDLQIQVSHDGVDYPLFSGLGGSGDSVSRTYLIDATGLDVSGAWTLSIDDTETGDQGKLLRWEVIAY